ncbi:hypothetical protein K3172_10650 [Qipengyuania sp. 6B39]|uniref:hypothetical protein n=1 Tax=Qipengyuania proteolytica TaxID=2867239 RepID=UPI001C89E6BF|nr:hypothetical protein [Qipengyuania proteolytica]MBX7496313.1 hypothetical protein [Qipengyuania proteolytica]
MASAAPELYLDEPLIVDHSVTGRSFTGSRSQGRSFGTVSALSAAIVAAAGLAPASAFAKDFGSTVGGQGHSAFYIDDRALLIDELRQYEMLEPGWDGGEKDVAPSRQAIDEAIQFVENIPPFIDLPEAMVSNDGEVGLFWHSQGFYLDVGFRGCGECSFFGKAGDLKVKGRGKTGSISPIPSELFDFFLGLTDDSAVFV